MSNPRASKRKGYEWEAACRRELRDSFPEVEPDAIERNGSHGNKDRGDIRGIPGWAIECKAEQRIDLPAYMRETEVERVNADEPFGVAFVKARGRQTRDGFAVMPISRWVDVAQLLAEFVPAGVLAGMRPSAVAALAESAGDPA